MGIPACGRRSTNFILGGVKTMNSAEERICRSTDDLPKPDVSKDGFGLYRGYYKLNCIHHKPDGTKTVEEGGFVLGEGHLWLAVRNDSYGIGWSQEEAIEAAKSHE